MHKLYVTMSLEQNLFYARIMKEHALFLEASLTPAEKDCAMEAAKLKDEFGRLLERTMKLSRGIVRPAVLGSGEMVTEFTLCAEEQTEKLTGIKIDQEITRKQEKWLNCHSESNCGCTPVCAKPACECAPVRDTSPCGCPSTGSPVRPAPLPEIPVRELEEEVCELNKMAISLVKRLIKLTGHILKEVNCGRMYTSVYPLMLKHMQQEAELYCALLMNYEKDTGYDCERAMNIEQFWNHIMMEHALFLRGLLDPCEDKLIMEAQHFVKDYSMYLEQCRKATEKAIRDSRKKTLTTTKAFCAYKTGITEGIEECKIQSIILPLLADHMLREACHYIRLLEETV